MVSCAKREKQREALVYSTICLSTLDDAVIVDDACHVIWEESNEEQNNLYVHISTCHISVRHDPSTLGDASRTLLCSIEHGVYSARECP